MARIIKTYPPTSRFNEDIIAQADRIKDIFMPEYSLKSFSFQSSENEVITFQASCYALDDSPGVHIKMVQKNAVNTLFETEEVVVDEIEFCDAVYNSIQENKRLSNNPAIDRICRDILDNFCTSAARGNKWFFDVRYKGFGVICSGKNIIATIDTVVFYEDLINLMHCVGNYNLNNVEDCSIHFCSNGRGFESHEFQMIKASNDEDGCCSYQIRITEGTDAEDLQIEDHYKAIKNLTAYDDNVEQFIEDRLKYLEETNGEEEEKENIYDLL